MTFFKIARTYSDGDLHWNFALQCNQSCYYLLYTSHFKISARLYKIFFFSPIHLLVHGNWTEWGDWGTCGVTCGKGLRMRFRWCTNPVPDNGGDFCVGAGNETEICNDIPCDGKIY